MSAALPHLCSKPASIHPLVIRTAQSVVPRHIPTNTRVSICARAGKRKADAGDNSTRLRWQSWGASTKEKSADTRTHSLQPLEGLVQTRETVPETPFRRTWPAFTAP